MPHEIPQGPWGKIGVCFFECQSTNYLIIIDYYSRFLNVIGVRSTTVNATINTMKQVFSEYVIPKIVMSDNGTKFKTKEF